MTTIRQRLLVVGAGGFAREIAWLAEEIASDGEPIEVAGFADDRDHVAGATLNGYPVVKFSEAIDRLRPDAFVVAVGSPAIREQLVTRAEALSLQPVTLVHPTVRRSRFVDLGRGTVICAGCILTTNIRIGAYVQVNLDCTIGHDAVLEDYATLAPGVHVSGQVRVGRGSYLGTGATVINGTADAQLIVGEGAVVGAAACVIGAVDSGATVVGVPARSRTP